MLVGVAVRGTSESVDVDTNGIGSGSPVFIPHLFATMQSLVKLPATVVFVSSLQAQLGPCAPRTESIPPPPGQLFVMRRSSTEPPVQPGAIPTTVSSSSAEVSVAAPIAASI